MRKLQKKTEKQIRDSIECSYCRYVKKCNFKSTFAFYEKQKNPIECWKRNWDVEYKNKHFQVGFHDPIMMNVRNTAIIYWKHVVDNKYSVLLEEFMYN